MGGNAFANEDPALPTPRMPEPIYSDAQQKYISILLKYYSHVGSPIEAPQKADYGDIDVLVTGSHSNVDMTDEMLCQILGARKFKRNSATICFAVPWPDCKERYIQIDVHFCPSVENFQWMLFHHSHGDLWNIVGTMIRPFGLTVNETGLYLRIWEIEGKVPKDMAKVKLTSDSGAVLRFLGLEEDAFKTKFASLDDMFDYITTCRFYSPRRWQHEGTLNANDRQRMGKRPQYRAWAEDYIPRRMNAGTNSCANNSKEEVCEMCKEHFVIGDTYETQRTHGLARIRKERFWTDVRNLIPYSDLR